MERKDNRKKSHDEAVVCEMAFWMGKRTDTESLSESLRETSEEVGCFSF
ncbi:MAG: hypothetical protein KBT05_08360 [Bacteroidales bacterium]|nr:hypothetical protein [Candidatus Cryptobacteroides caccocaballi]